MFIALLQSLTVGHSAYSSLWYQLNNADKRVMVLLMIRSQRRLTITAGKFVDLSMEGFGNVSSLFLTKYSFYPRKLLE